MFDHIVSVSSTLEEYFSVVYFGAKYKENVISFIVLVLRLSSVQQQREQCGTRHGAFMHPKLFLFLPFERINNLYYIILIGIR